MTEDQIDKEPTDEETPLTLSDDVGALVVSVVLFVVGGLLLASGWGTVAKVVGGLVGLFGLITGRVQFSAILRRLWRGDFGKR